MQENVERDSKMIANPGSPRKGNEELDGTESLLVVQQEIPVDRDRWGSLRTPSKAEHALASLLAASLGLAPVDVPHPEGDMTGRVNDDLIFLYRASIPFVLLVVRVRVTNVNVGVRLGGA